MAYGVIPSGWANEANAWRREQMNDPRLTTFSQARQLVTDELIKMVKGGQLNQAELEQFQSNLQASNSPEQLRAAIADIATLANGRVEALRTQWHSVMGDNVPEPAALHSSSVGAVFDKVQGRLRAGSGPDPFAQPGAAQGGPSSNVGNFRAPAPGRLTPDALQGMNPTRRGLVTDKALFEAHKAIQAGKSRDAVIERLRAFGIDPSGL